jgi:hypothetical protein
MPICAGTISLSAFLLFLEPPIIAEPVLRSICSGVGHAEGVLSGHTAGWLQAESHPEQSKDACRIVLRRSEDLAGLI